MNSTLYVANFLNKTDGQSAEHIDTMAALILGRR